MTDPSGKATPGADQQEKRDEGNDLEAKNKSGVDWGQLTVDALNRHTSTPEFKRRYLKWLEEMGAHTPVAKADLEALMAEKARGEF